MSTQQSLTLLPTTQEIRDTFADEITTLGGAVSDVADDGQLVFARAVLAADTEIRVGDTVCSGVALRATATEIVVHPYTFRRVCSNGAIAAQSLQSQRLERIQSTDVFVPTYEVAVALSNLRDAIRSCAAPEAFAVTAEEMRSAADAEADTMLQLLPMMSRLPRQTLASLLPQIARRFNADGDRSAFGLMNAVTSIARDTRDPETRWSLEELGGSIPARLGQRAGRYLPAPAAAKA